MTELSEYEKAARELRAHGINVSAIEVQGFVEATEGLIVGAEADRRIREFKEKMEKKPELDAKPKKFGFVERLRFGGTVREQRMIPCPRMKYNALDGIQCYCTSESFEDFLVRVNLTVEQFAKLDAKAVGKLPDVPKGYYKNVKCLREITFDLQAQCVCLTYPEETGLPFGHDYYAAHPEKVAEHAALFRK
jgi:hypothetical protein